MSSQPQTSGGNNADPELQSWSAVEGELKTHDQQMVKDYAEDVDNLLVFAGLFSAVLTAFLVESYKMLQEDNEETNKYLLARISTQLESFSLTPGFANATRLGALPPPFTPSRAALWINALWFLSLIFSLSAAFFGIRVRQWLREYMQWCAALAHPRENVHLRQIRFTDFQRWRVFGSISVIPGLLALALVLFVSPYRCHRHHRGQLGVPCHGVDKHGTACISEALPGHRARSTNPDQKLRHATSTHDPERSTANARTIETPRRLDTRATVSNDHLPGETNPMVQVDSEYVSHEPTVL